MNTISNPYIGPRTFTEDERDRFYGREREADELLARVLSEQEVVFYAQSGAGKSSLVNTCLIPQLREDGIEVLLGRVGGEAPAGLEVDNIFVFNLLRSLSTSDVNADTLARGSLIEFLMPAAEGRVSKRRALIIDQFEEIFSTHAEAWEKRKGFFKQLAHALKADRRMRVVLVMREDYIASLDPYARLLPGRFQVRYYMQRLEYAAALKAVTEPVKGGDFSRPYEAGVAEKLVDDLRSVKVYKSDGTEAMEPGQYVEPVQLQVVCFNLWENLPAGGTQITEQDLQNLDDVSASFVSASLGKYYAMRVKAVAEPKQVDERRIREWFTGKLISPTGVRNMVLQERGGKSGGLENDVIQALSDLVRAETRGGAIFYELTHDRLVEPIIANNRTWFERNLQNLSPLQQQAALWNAQDRAVSWLVSDQALTEVEQWAKDHPDELTQLEEDFLEASRMNQYEQDEKRRLAREARTKRQLTIAIVVAVMTLALAAFGGLSAREALRQAATAQAASTLAAQAQADSNQAAIISRSRELAIQAELLNRLDSDLDQAILLSIEAFQADDNPKTLSSLFTSLQKSADIRRILDANEADYLQFGSDGNSVAVSNEEGITLQDLDGDILGGPFPGHPSSIFSTSFSPNGETLAASSKDGSILLWETEGWSPLGNALTDHVDWTNNVIFTADGKTLISLSDDGNIILWDITHRDKPVNLSTEATGDAVNDAILNPKVPDILVSTDRIGSIILWDISKRDDPVLINKFDHNELHTIVDMAFSEDGQLLASGDLDGTMVLWDFSKPRTPEVFATEQESNVAIHCVAISWDGNVLVAGNEDGSINLWDISNPRDPFLIGEPLVLHEGIVNSLAFSPDGRTFASGSFDGKVLLWDLAERGGCNGANRRYRFHRLFKSREQCKVQPGRRSAGGRARKRIDRFVGGV